MKALPAILAAFAILAAAACNRQRAVQAKQDSGPLKVDATVAQARDIRRTVDSVGSLFPFDETVISAEIDGKVEQVNVDLGDQVRAGQPLVHIQDEEQRYLVAQTQAQLRQAMERLGLRNEADRVKDVRDTPDVRRAEADLFDAEQRYNRVKKIFDQGIASASDLDQAQARFKAAQAAYDASQFGARNLIQEIERSRAQLDLQRKKLRDAIVRAPYAGSVKERSVNVGQYVTAKTPLLTIVKTDPLRLRLEIPERMAPWIKTGQDLEFAVEAFQDRAFPGRIWRISPSVDQSKRTFIVEALIDNKAALLKPGSYGRAHVPTGKTERITVVPARAINYVFGTNKAYVVKDGVVEARDVKIGDRYESDIEVVEGVREGERVALSQLGRLDTGSKVSVTERSVDRRPAQRSGDGL